jgi:hypothetical protein
MMRKKRTARSDFCLIVVAGFNEDIALGQFADNGREFSDGKRNATPVPRLRLLCGNEFQDQD